MAPDVTDRQYFIINRICQDNIENRSHEHKKSDLMIEFQGHINLLQQKIYEKVWKLILWYSYVLYIYHIIIIIMSWR